MVFSLPRGAEMGLAGSPHPIVAIVLQTCLHLQRSESSHGEVVARGVARQFKQLCMEQSDTTSIYPLVNKQLAIENGHRNSGFTQLKW